MLTGKSAARATGKALYHVIEPSLSRVDLRLESRSERKRPPRLEIVDGDKISSPVADICPVERNGILQYLKDLSRLAVASQL